MTPNIPEADIESDNSDLFSVKDITPAVIEVKNYIIKDLGRLDDDEVKGPTYERPVTGDEYEDDSNYETTIQRRKNNKKFLFEWLTEADFTQDVSLSKLINHQFTLDKDEGE